jgi:hypothetical protein
MVPIVKNRIRLGARKGRYQMLKLRRIVSRLLSPSLSRKTLYFTICTTNYLPYAKTLAQSLKQADATAQFAIFLIESGATTEIPGLMVVPVGSVGVSTLGDMASRYSALELSCALKPFCFEHVFDKMGFERAVYLDSDLLILRKFTDVDDAFNAGASSIFTPHITRSLNGRMCGGLHPNDESIQRAGIFNLGFVAFSNVPDARNFIVWWREKVRENCYHDFERGLHGDQRFCDFAPAFMSCIKILRHPGYNVAYWNFGQRPLRRGVNGYWIDRYPVHFIHFSGFDPHNPSIVSVFQSHARTNDIGIVGELFGVYVELLSKNEPALGERYSAHSGASTDKE